MSKKFEVEKYVLCASNENPKGEIEQEQYFDSAKECHDWIDQEDPKKQFGWAIYSVSIKIADLL